jgi:hypothetical protein
MNEFTAVRVAFTYDGVKRAFFLCWLASAFSKSSAGKENENTEKEKLHQRIFRRPLRREEFSFGGGASVLEARVPEQSTKKMLMR